VGGFLKKEYEKRKGRGIMGWAKKRSRAGGYGEVALKTQ